MNEPNIKASGWALLPILVFLILFLGTGILLNDFYTMPAVVGFLIALAVAFFQTRGKTFSEKLSIVARGVGDDQHHHHVPDLSRGRRLLRRGIRPRAA